MLSSFVTSSLMVLYLVKYGICDERELEVQSDEPHIVYRPGSSSLCPPRAVCADDFTYRRRINGKTVQMKRRIFNCRCDLTTIEVCPISNETMLYASAINKQYLCRPISTLPLCNADDSNRLRNRFRVAEEMEQNSPAFDYRNFYRINCICPRHFEPMPQIPGQLQRATKYHRTEMDMVNFRIYQQYICAV